MTRSEFVELIEKANSMDKISSLIFKVFDEKEALEQHIAELEKERANIQKTHQQTIESYRKDIAKLEQHIVELENTTIPFLTMTENQALRERIKELESPKTCNECKHHTYETDHYGLCHRNGFPEDTAYYWTCGGFEPKKDK